MKRFRNNQKGFTLVEIMSVVAIISMITAMSVPNFLRVKVNSNEAAAQASLKSLYTLIEDYRFANGIYPADKSQITTFVNSYYGKQSIISNLDSSGNYFAFQGYRFDYRQPNTGTFEWIAMPDVMDVTGTKLFIITEAGPRSDATSGATSSSSGLQEVNRLYADTNYPDR